ncbi:MAG: tripartite tricarboxylate transporter TctB family protein [Streptosporangiales bacterium]|nr:tripartite tricarboxylate transporter TctB family protein [Streptosporangiales bacterium]
MRVSANVRELATWAVIGALGAAFAVGGLGYGLSKEGGQVGPGLLPALTGGLLLLTALAQVVRTLLGSATPPESGETVVAAEEDLDGRTTWQRTRILWTVFGLTLVALLLVSLLGFLAAFGLLVLVISVAVERRPVVPALVISGVAVAAVYAIFVLFLRVPLPGGVFGIGGEAG